MFVSVLLNKTGAHFIFMMTCKAKLALIDSRGLGGAGFHVRPINNDYLLYLI